MMWAMAAFVAPEGWMPSVVLLLRRVTPCCRNALYVGTTTTFSCLSSLKSVFMHLRKDRADIHTRVNECFFKRDVYFKLFLNGLRLKCKISRAKILKSLDSLIGFFFNDQWHVSPGADGADQHCHPLSCQLFRNTYSLVP